MTKLVKQPRVNFSKLQKELLVKSSSQTLYDKIANAPFEQKPGSVFLFLGLISFFLVDEDERIVKLAAVSDTEQYNLSVSGYKFTASNYQLSLEADASNDIVKAILSGRPQTTGDWSSLSRREADLEQVSLNQASGGIAYSVTEPLVGTTRGALLYCYFQYPENIGDAQKDFMTKYTKLVSQALDEAK